MANTKTDANKIKELNAKVHEMHSILLAIKLMELNKDWPVKLNEALDKQLNGN
jgi:hypothetical protein